MKERNKFIEFSFSWPSFDRAKNSILMCETYVLWRTFLPLYKKLLIGKGRYCKSYSLPPEAAGREKVRIATCAIFFSSINKTPIMREIAKVFLGNHLRNFYFFLLPKSNTKKCKMKKKKTIYTKVAQAKENNIFVLKVTKSMPKENRTASPSVWPGLLKIQLSTCLQQNQQ